MRRHTGFQNEAMLLVRNHPPADSRRRFAERAGQLLVCEDVCIPEDGKFELSLRSAHAATRRRPPRARFYSGVPTESPWPARYGLAKSGDPA